MLLLFFCCCVDVAVLNTIVAVVFVFVVAICLFVVVATIIDYFSNKSLTLNSNPSQDFGSGEVGCGVQPDCYSPEIHSTQICDPSSEQQHHHDRDGPQ